MVGPDAQHTRDTRASFSTRRAQVPLVLHLAGALADGLVTSAAAAQLATTTRPKTGGLDALRAAATRRVKRPLSSHVSRVTARERALLSDPHPTV